MSISTDIKKKSLDASIWSSIDTLAQKGLSFIVTMILARLLTPSDYGVIGMLAIFIGLSITFIESGFPHAIIQRRDINEIDISSVFFFNIGIGFLCCILLCLAAPWIASFFNIPVLTPLTRFTAINLFIGSFGSVQRALLTKELNFKKISIISILGIFVSGIVALTLAWYQFGVWSLAIQYMVMTIVTTILLWRLSSWRPRIAFSLQSIRSLSKFSIFILFSVMIETLYNRLNTMLIGKWYSAKDLGYYTRADQTQQYSGELIARIFSSVAFPIFAAAQDDKTKLKTGMKKAVPTAVMINAPLMFGLFVTARPMVRLLFGDQWDPCVQYLQILCIGGLLIPLHSLNEKVLSAQGYSNLSFRINLINRVIGVILVGTACFISITAIAFSAAVTGVIWFFINTHYTRKILDYGAIKQIRDFFPFIVGSAIMAVCIWAITLFQINTPIVLVSIQILVGITVYCSFCYLFKLNIFIEFLQILKSVTRKLPFVGKVFNE